MTSALDIADSKGRKQAKLLTLLIFVFGLIFFEPSLRAGMTKLLPREPIRLGIAEISITKEWMTIEKSARVDAWKPCKTILCSASTQPTLVVEVSKLPLGSDQIWENAARTVIRKYSSGDPVSGAVYAASGVWKCVEADPGPSQRNVMTSCSNSDLRLNASFFGEASLKPSFYSVLISGHKI